MLTTTALIIALIYGYAMAFTMHTKDIASAIFFKQIPFTMSTFALVALVVANLEWLLALV